MGVAERRERERQARRGAVLEAARQVLLEKGFRGTTTREVAKRCELSEATLFFYFKNKDEILVSLLFESICFWADGLEKLKKSRLNADKLLDKIWQFHEEVNDKHPEYYAVSAYLAQSGALIGVSEEVKEEIVHLSGENFQRLADLLEQATGHGGGQRLADTLWSMFLGLMVLRDFRINLGHEEVRTAKRDRAAVFETLKQGLLSSGGK